jgi:type IV secretion system protein VirB10
MTALDTAPEPAPREPAAETASSAGLDRTISPIAGRFSGGTAAKAITMGALVTGCGVFMLASGHHAPAKAKAPVEPAAQVVSFEPAKSAPPTLAAPGAGAPSLDGSTAAGQVPPLPGAGAPGAASPGSSSAQTAAQSAAQARAAQVQAIRGAPILAFSHGGGVDGPVVPSITEALAPPAEAVHAPTELDQLRQGSTIGLVHASRLPDRHFLITAGTAIPCTLQTAMDTATPGYVNCLIGQDVYSDDGTVILMEKGAKVLGEYRSGMKQGQSRLFVLWTRVVTPAGVAIGLASPASDTLGRSGFDGAIDTHFWARFGGALLLSIIDDSSAAVASRTDSNGETVRVPSDAAGIALQNSINIPPSLKKNQGSQVSIFVAQDLDFSTVYALKAR